MCKLLAQHYNVVVLDMVTLAQPAVAEFEKKRLDKVKEEATQDAIKKIKMEITSGRMNYLSGLQMPHYTKGYSLVVVQIHLINCLIFFFSKDGKDATEGKMLKQLVS